MYVNRFNGRIRFNLNINVFYYTLINKNSLIFEASQGVVDICLDLFGTHSLSDLGEDAEHTFGIFNLAVALLLHLFDDLLLFLDIHHDTLENERVFKTISGQSSSEISVPPRIKGYTNSHKNEVFKHYFSEIVLITVQRYPDAVFQGCE